MKDRIFLIGFMGSGKTTLGRKLARKMKFNFVDMDALIQETAELSIPEIFEEHGETVFRKWERDILLELGKREKIVISTGGGAPCHDDMMEIMNRLGTTIYLEMNPPSLADRLLNSKTERPLIQGKTGDELLEFISGLLEQREVYYKQAAYIVDAVNPNTESLIRILNERE